MAEKEEESAVLALLALSESPNSKNAFQASQALAVEAGTSQGPNVAEESTRLALMGTYREKATRTQKERMKKLEKQREKDWVRTQRLANRIMQMKIIRTKTRLSAIHRMACKKRQWPTLCALLEQIKHFASHPKSTILDITLFYLATFPVDGATYDCIYDFLRMVKDGGIDYVDTYIELVTSPFLKETSFFVDSDGQHHSLPDIINDTPFVSSQVSYFTHILEEDYARGSRKRAETCKWIQAETKRLAAKD